MSHPQSRSLRFIELDTGCFVCASHKTDHAGYFHKSWGNPRLGEHVREYFHRTIWRMHKGEIPDGYEIDHTCLNRACCNVNHLRCMTGSEHAAHTGRTIAARYAPRTAAAKKFWLEYKPRVKELAAEFGVDQSKASRWTTQWKSEMAQA